MEVGETFIKRSKKERRARTSTEELDRMLRGEHVLPYVLKILGRGQDGEAFPTLSTCPEALILPPAISRKIAKMTRKTLKDTKEREYYGYLGSSDNSLDEVRFHLGRTSRPLSYYLKKGEPPNIEAPSIEDKVDRRVRIPLITIHTHPEVKNDVGFMSMQDLVAFIFNRPTPFEVISYQIGATLFVKCKDFFDSPVFDITDLYQEINRLDKIWEYYAENLAASERFVGHEEFLAAICGLYGIAYYTSVPRYPERRPLIGAGQTLFRRVDPCAKLKDVEEIEKKVLSSQETQNQGAS